ncbi:MAG: tetraacyldisaccharide 4'-kinase [Planctomycetota bacterium]
MGLDGVQAGRSGIGAACARLGLRVLSFGWWAAWYAKRAAYAVRLRRRNALTVPVISIGNLAVGGTGKTPFTAWLAQGLLERGRKPGILSRGYGARAAAIVRGEAPLSDEGAVLQHVLGGDVPQVEDPNRLHGGRELLRAHPGTDTLLLDDGFQHWALRRDLDIVLLDATRPFGYGHLLPRGRLREPARALARAGLVVVTRAERISAEDLAGIRATVARHTRAPVAVARTRATALARASGSRPPDALAGQSVFACCGIGNPAAFEAFLADLGANVVGSRILPDHAALDDDAVPALVEEAQDAGAAFVVITRKDAVKRLRWPDAIAVLDVETQIVEGEAALWDAVEAAYGSP